MTKIKQDKKWRPAYTVRLEPELYERLRDAAYTHRVKKQPLLREAIQKLLERENARPVAALRKRWKALSANQPATTMPEAVILTAEQDDALRKFCYDLHPLRKQTVTRQALIEYLEHLETASRHKRSGA